MPLLSPRHLASSLLSKRSLSLNEVSVALRPFYFAVHPDRFATNPTVRQQNERSLQIFNGYLNDLFPVQSSIRPTEIRFSIVDKGRNAALKNIKISLSGTDPIRIAREALEQCELSTKDLPESNSFHGATTFSNPESGPFGPGVSTSNVDENDLLKMYLRKKKKNVGNDLGGMLRTSRSDLLKRAKDAEATKLTLKDEIEDVKWRTGAKDVVWQMDWAESHMRRCLGNLHRMLDQADATEKETIIQALYKTTLRFGRGSFICCDGSIQFGADHVPEQWGQTCSEAVVRRSQLPQLSSAVKELRRYLGDAILLTPEQNGLAQTLQQIESLITRIKNRPDLHTSLAKNARNAMFEVVTSYDELDVGVDGRLYIPSNVDVASMVAFIEENAQKSRRLNEQVLRMKVEVENECYDCVRRLRLAGLEWESGLRLADVLKAIKRLLNADKEMHELLHGVGVRLSMNPTVYIMSDGRLSVPLNWI